ncbi:hypothetical protein BH10ACI2_BH10ACI2_08390 [soil metagenome]
MGILGGLGSVLLLVGFIWTIITAFKKGGTLWGVLNILICVQPIIGIVSAAMKKAEWLPVILMILGSLLSSVGLYPMMTDMMKNMPR